MNLVARLAMYCIGGGMLLAVGSLLIGLMRKTHNPGTIDLLFFFGMTIAYFGLCLGVWLLIRLIEDEF